jgi:hypothetical protein
LGNLIAQGFLQPAECLLNTCCDAPFIVLQHCSALFSLTHHHKAYLSGMKNVSAFLLFACVFSRAYAQTADDSVKSVINNLFTSMRNGNAAMLKDCFADSAILQTITSKGQVRTDNVAEFARQIAFLPKGDADERISFDVVKVDGGLAIAWTPYKFYYKGAFSHCGVNSFQLVRMNGRWKIQYLIDTRRKENCL